MTQISGIRLFIKTYTACHVYTVTLFASTLPHSHFYSITVAAQNFCQKISKLLSKLSGKYFPALTQQNRDLNQRFPDGTGLQWDGTNFWGTTADGMKVKLGSLTYRDFTVTPTANSGSMSIDISDIPNYKDLILWETLFPRMLSDLDMANWNTSMLRTGVGYDWNYDADKGILSISSRHTECVLIQYGTGLKQRTVRVHYI